MDISVVLNTRDRPERLGLVLRCLARQRELPGGLEVLVVDDGSTRDLSPSLESLGALDVRLIRQPPLGYAVARNVGLGAAAGEVVLWLDDDILFDPLFVAEHLAVHVEHEHSVVVGDRYNTYLADLDSPRSRSLVTAALAGDWAGLRRQSRRDFYARVTLRLFELDSGGQPAPWLNFVTRNVSFRRDDAKAVGGFDEGFQQWGIDDIELGLRLHQAGVGYHYRPRARVYHLETPLHPGKYQALQESLRYFRGKHRGLEPGLFEDFVLGRLSIEELCASLRSGHRQELPDRDSLTFFQTQR